MSDADKWIEISRECSYLPENDLKVRDFVCVLVVHCGSSGVDLLCGRFVNLASVT